MRRAGSNKYRAKPIVIFKAIVFAPSDAKLTKVGRYTADFAYIDCQTGQRVIEDTKSTATATEAYRLRKKHVEAQYGITVREV
jgi:hypothetical protein